MTAPSFRIVAEDATGTDREIAVTWATSNPQVFTGTLDIEGAGEKIKIRMYKTPDRPQAVAKPATALKPAA